MKRRSGLRLGLLVVAGAISSCAQHRYGTLPPRAPLPAMPDGARCTFDDLRLVVPTDTSFFAADHGDTMVGHFDTDVRARVEREVVFGPGGSKRAALSLAIPADGPALHLHGYLDLTELDLTPSHDLAIVPDRVWIPAGGRVQVVAGEGARVRVTPALVHDELEVAVDVPCNALVGYGSLEGVQPQPTPPSVHDEPFHLSGASMTIYDTVDGHPIERLTPRSPDTFELVVIDEGDGFSRIFHESRSLHVDAWIPNLELVSGEAADCDDCDGRGVRDSMDACPDDGSTSNTVGPGCPGIIEARAIRDTPVLVDEHPVGSVDKDTRVYIVQTKGDTVKIGFDAMTAGGAGFWADRSAFAADGTSP